MQVSKIDSTGGGLNPKIVMDVFLSDYICKLNVAGKALCKVCNHTILYGGAGKKALTKHGNCDAHKKVKKIQHINQTLAAVVKFINVVESGEAGKGTVVSGDVQGPCTMPYGAPPNVHQSAVCSGKRDAPTPNFSYADRKANAEAMEVSFTAENNLPFTMTAKLIDLAKELDNDNKVLHHDISLDRTSCTYKLKDRLAVVCHKRLVSDMKKNGFSINIDECTAQNNKRVLSVLVSYFSESLGMCVVQHYMSVKMTTVNANTVYQAIIKAIKEDGIPLENVVSSLSDLAAYMRGKNSGFEKKLRDVAPNMLDIQRVSIRSHYPVNGR